MVYRIAEIGMTLSDLQKLPVSRLLKWICSYTCVAFDKISSDIERHAVPLWELSLLLELGKVDVLHVRLTELHAAHQNLPLDIRTLRLYLKTVYKLLKK